MNHQTHILTIGRLARTVGVNVETIRFYQRKGLLRTPPRPPGRFRCYTEQDLARLKFIKSAQGLGFRLDEIDRLLRLDDGMQCQAAAELAARHLSDVRARLRDLGRIEATLNNLIELCAQGNEKAACPLITALYVEERGKD